MSTPHSTLGWVPRATWRSLPRIGWLGQDAHWLISVAAGVVVLCAVPYLVTDLFGRPDLQRIGTFWFVHDFSQYQAAMREGARESSWLIHDHFSAEPHTAALMYPLYVASGKLAALAALDPLGVFSALEWLGRGAVVGSLYVFARTFLNDSRQRALSLILALGTLGLDAFAAPLKLGLAGLGLQLSWLPDDINPYLEISSFGMLLSAPHLMFALALTLLAAPLYLACLRSRGRRWVPVLLLFADVLALSVMQVFNLPVLISVLLVHAVMTGRRAWPAAVTAATAAAPLSLYSAVLFSTDPFWSNTYGGRQNLMLAPLPWNLPIDFGVVLIAAPLAWPVVRRWPVERRRLLLLWVGLGLLWMYAPVPYQRRFAFGLQPALAVLAAAGLLQAHARWRWPAAVNLGIAIAAAATPVIVYVSLVASAATNWPADIYLWSWPEANAAAWLADRSGPADVVLASTDFSNALAGTIDGRVVCGHGVATLHFTDKKALVREFFAQETSTERRSALLAQTGTTIVALGPRERAMGLTPGELSQQPELQMMYDRDGVSLWRVDSHAVATAGRASSESQPPALTTGGVASPSQSQPQTLADAGVASPLQSQPQALATAALAWRSQSQARALATADHAWRSQSPAHALATADYASALQVHSQALAAAGRRAPPPLEPSVPAAAGRGSPSALAPQPTGGAGRASLSALAPHATGDAGRGAPSDLGSQARADRHPMPLADA